MTIYILDNDPAKCAEYLDDRSLKFMIKDIAQVLSNTWWHICDKNKPLLPPTRKNNIEKWSELARECVVNYKELVELAVALCDEHAYRFYDKDKIHPVVKYEKVIAWARDNVPDLDKIPGMKNSDGNISDGAIYSYVRKKEAGLFTGTPFPLVMPKKHIKKMELTNPERYGHIKNEIYAYRIYYAAKLEKHLKKHHCTEQEMSWAWTKRGKPTWIEL